MKKRSVVITGVGACAPGKPGREALWNLLSDNCSAIRFQPEMQEHGFQCQVGGLPVIPDEMVSSSLEPSLLHNGYSLSLLYSVISARECWEDAGLRKPGQEDFYPRTGCIYGSGNHGIDELRRAIYKVDSGNGRRIRSSTVFQTMNSGSAAYLSGLFGLGGYVSANSSACATGTEAVLLAYHRIALGFEDQMLAGSTSEGGVYVWGGFDALRILPRSWNNEPQRASRPMDQGSQGFVPSGGAACFYLETLESARERGAKIYAEVLGGHMNCGGQRQGGSMTAVNPQAAMGCIRQALEEANIRGDEVDTINGHLTGTDFDQVEVVHWKKALATTVDDFPLLNTFKGHLGHALAASGSLELAGVLGQFRLNRVFGNANLEDIKPEIANTIPEHSLPRRTVSQRPEIVVKASFGFGDVNCCLVLKSMD